MQSYAKIMLCYYYVINTNVNIWLHMMGHNLRESVNLRSTNFIKYKYIDIFIIFGETFLNVESGL
jgi:hypothetical protein